MPINRYRNLIEQRIAATPVGNTFKLKDLLAEVWNDGDLTDVEKRTLGKQFRNEAERPPFDTVQWERRDGANAAHYRKVR